jgi:hypothetical protein
MRVSEPRLGPSSLGEERQRATVLVEYERGDHAPEAYWIDVPERAGGAASSANPWGVALLPLAATLGEPLTLAGSVDALLLENLRELLRVWRAWYPYVAEIEIRSERVDPAPGGDGRTAALFSGGVDSFYTLLRDRTDLHPLERVEIQDLVTIWGLDIPLHNAQAFARLRERFQRLAASTGRELLDVATNLRETRWRETNWGEVGHGCALAAACHALEGRLSRVLIPSTAGYRDLHPWASHPMTDRFFSSAALAFVHDGASARRVDKLATIAASDSALGELRVCWRLESERNCGRCPKCLRTMLALHLLDAQGKASSFPPAPPGPAEVRRLHCTWSWDFRELRDLVELASTRGRSDLVDALESAMRKSRTRGRLLQWVARGRSNGGRGPLSALERLILRGTIR